MPGIAGLSVHQFHARVRRFDEEYVTHWNVWLGSSEDRRAELFGSILRQWQACRPNRMRRTRAEGQHDAPYLDDLMVDASPFLASIVTFDISQPSSYTTAVRRSLDGLWHLLGHLSYCGRARNGFAGAVGISKAVLLLTNGRVGPAFDSEVRKHLGIRKIDNAEQWSTALEAVTADIGAFEKSNQCRFREAFPTEFLHLHAGRVYDMALGPGD